MENWMWWAVAGVAVYMAMKPGIPAAAQLSPGDVRDAISASKDLQLIDVRTPEENKAGRIAGSKLIPLGELSSRLGEIDKSKPVILYCRSGNRSGQGLKILFASGYKDAKHLQGGIGAWSAAGLPVAK
jgi:rhodanese-related sulfurtransferase